MQVPLEKASYVLLLNKGALPRAVVYYAWEGVEEGSELKRLADPSWNPWKTVLGSSSIGSREGNVPADPARITEYSTTRITVQVSAKTDAILLLNDKYDANWHVNVDGEDKELLRCNYIMRGVRVPAGAHNVVFSYRSPYLMPVWVRVGSLLLAISWCVARIVPFRRKSFSQ